MGRRYEVKGGVGGVLPGALGPDELDGRAEWVPFRRRGDLLDALAARLGSEVDLGKVVLAVLCPLRPALDGAPLGAIARTLPHELARELADAELNLCTRVATPAGAGDYLLDVSRMLLHPPVRAASYVRAVFAAAKAVLAPADAEAIAARLPPELAELWRAAR